MADFYSGLPQNRHGLLGFLANMETDSLSSLIDEIRKNPVDALEYIRAGGGAPSFSSNQRALNEFAEAVAREKGVATLADLMTQDQARMGAAMPYAPDLPDRNLYKEAQGFADDPVAQEFVSSINTLKDLQNPAAVKTRYAEAIPQPLHGLLIGKDGTPLINSAAGNVADETDKQIKSEALRGAGGKLLSGAPMGLADYRALAGSTADIENTAQARQALATEARNVQIAEEAEAKANEAIAAKQNEGEFLQAIGGLLKPAAAPAEKQRLASREGLAPWAEVQDDIYAAAADYGITLERSPAVNSIVDNYRQSYEKTPMGDPQTKTTKLGNTTKMERVQPMAFGPAKVETTVSDKQPVNVNVRTGGADGSRLLIDKGRFDNDPQVKRFEKTREAQTTLAAAKATGEKGLYDNALLMFWGKGLDPDSAYMLGELQRDKKFQSYLQQGEAGVSKILSSKALSAKYRDALSSVMEQTLRSRANAYNERVQTYRRVLSKKYNADDVNSVFSSVEATPDAPAARPAITAKTGSSGKILYEGKMYTPDKQGIITTPKGRFRVKSNGE